MGVNILDEPKDSMTCEKLRNPPSSASSSSTSTGRIMGVPIKPWKSRSKSQSRLGVTAKCHWSHEGPGRWRNSQGQVVAVKKVSLLQTFEAERIALQKLGLTRLQEMNMGCPLEVPKLENAPAQQTKKRTMLLRKKAVTTNFFENKEKEKSNSSLPVFGVPLSQCLVNDRLRMRTIGNDPNLGMRTYQKDHREELLSLLRIFPGNSSDTGSQSYNASLDMRYLSPSVREELTVTRDSIPDIYFGELQVPLVVQTCIRFLKSKGLNTLGIFRVSGAQKRVRQLREDLENNKLLILDDSTQPHDVAQLLKEYFRDLPEPLLPKALYAAFLAIQGISDPERRVKACRWLLYLLPVVHRDTLAALLAFLQKVSQYSEDFQRKDGSWITGNKMNAPNLATVFGPNILRSEKNPVNSELSYSMQILEKAQERSDMILTVRLLIENYQELFQVTSEDLDSIYLQFMLDDPDMLNAILSRRYDILMSEEPSEKSSREIRHTVATEAFTRCTKQEPTYYPRELMDAPKSSGLTEDIRSRGRPLTLAKGELERNTEYPRSVRYVQEERSDFGYGDRRTSNTSAKYNVLSPTFAVTASPAFAVTAAFTIKMATKGSPGILPMNVIEQDQKPSPKARRVPYGKTRHLTTPAYITEETITNITIPPPRNSFRGVYTEISHRPVMHDRMDNFRPIDISEQHDRSRIKAMEGSRLAPSIPERWKRQEIIASEHRVHL